MSSRAVVVVALAAAFASIAGCGNRAPLAPSTAPYLVMEWTAARASTASGPILRLTARITNRGGGAATYWGGLDGDALGYVLHDPEHRHVMDLCGCPGIACPLWVPVAIARQIEPGQTVTFERTFAGMLQDCSGPFPGPAGRYVAIATFGAMGSDGTGISLTRTLEFHWAPPAP